MAAIIDRKRKHKRRLMSIEDPSVRVRKNGSPIRRIRKRPDTILYQSRQWRAMRKHMLAHNPVCVKCKLMMATEVDHIRPHKLNRQLFFNMSNLQTLCRACHQEKTTAERQNRVVYENGK